MTSTTQTAAREALYLAFETGWVAANPTYPHFFENEHVKADDQTTPWARFSVRHAAAPQRTLGGPGNRKFNRIGTAIAQIFTFAEQAGVSPGMADADTLSTLVRNLFEGESIPGTNIRFTEVAVREQGVDGKWYQTNVEAAFEYDETK